MGIHVCDNQPGASTGSIQYTPWILDGAGWSPWASDSNWFGPDGFNIGLFGRDNTASSSTSINDMDIRFGIQATRKLTDSEGNPVYDGDIQYTEWASNGGGWSDVAITKDGGALDGVRITVEVQNNPGLVININNIRVGIEAGAPRHDDKYSSYLTDGTTPAWSDWSMSGSNAVKNVKIYLDIVIETDEPTPNPTPEPLANDICTYPECSSDVALDIGFLMDESGSIDSTEWQTMVDFVERLIKWDINDISYITLIEYGSIDDFNQFLDFTQSTQSNKASIINTLQNNEYESGGATYTKDAVERSLEIFKKWDITNDPKGERANLLFLLTDGEPTDKVCDDLANKVSLSNVNIVLIGIGDGLDAITWTDKLDCLYGDKSQNTFYVSQFTEKEFNRIEGDLRDKTCQNKLNIEGNNNAAMSPFKYSQPSSSYLWILRSELKSARKEIQVLYVLLFGLFIYSILTCIGFIYLYSSKQNKVVYIKTFSNDPDQL